MVFDKQQRKRRIKGETSKALSLSTLFLFLFLFSVTFISSEDFGYNYLEGDLDITRAINYSQVNVNNSDYWAGHPFAVGEVSSIETDPFWTANFSLYNSSWSDKANIDDGTVDGQLVYWNATSGKWEPVSTSNIYWDTSNNRFSIGSNSPPTSVMFVKGAGDYPFVLEPTLLDGGWKMMYGGVDKVGIRLTGEANGGLRFMTGGVTNTYERMRISDDGLVTIGSSSTPAQFSIYNDGTSANTLVTKDSSLNTIFYIGDGTFAHFGNLNVGIGDTAPRDQLEVGGNIVQDDTYKTMQGSSDDVSMEFNGTAWNFLQEVGAGTWVWNTNTGLINIISNVFINGGLDVNGNVNITGNLNLTENNMTDVDCIIFKSGGQICSGS